jgi:hypothetical protein
VALPEGGVPGVDHFGAHMSALHKKVHRDASDEAVSNHFDLLGKIGHFF